MYKCIHVRKNKALLVLKQLKYPHLDHFCNVADHQLNKFSIRVGFKNRGVRQKRKHVVIGTDTEEVNRTRKQSVGFCFT